MQYDFVADCRNTENRISPTYFLSAGERGTSFSARKLVGMARMSLLTRVPLGQRACVRFPNVTVGYPSASATSSSEPSALFSQVYQRLAACFSLPNSFLDGNVFVYTEHVSEDNSSTESILNCCNKQKIKGVIKSWTHTF